MIKKQAQMILFCDKVTVPAHHANSHYFCEEDLMGRLIDLKIERNVLRAFNQADLSWFIAV